MKMRTRFDVVFQGLFRQNKIRSKLKIYKHLQFCGFKPTFVHVSSHSCLPFPTSLFKKFFFTRDFELVPHLVPSSYIQF
jgi:hypothetical protein